MNATAAGADRARRGFAVCASVRATENAWLARLAPGELMARAADALATRADLTLRALPRATPVLGLVGPGNNGGDALEAMCRLAERGFPVEAFALGRPGAKASDAIRAHSRWVASGGPPAPLGEFAARLEKLDGPALVLDGLFGIGLTRRLPEVAAQAIAALAADGRAHVIAIDVPSGLDADLGSPVGGGPVVRAHETVTMIADKPGLHTGAGVEYAGVVTIADLGLPDAQIDGDAIDRDWCAARLARRRPNAHKGEFGTIVVVGGAASMPGAALLAALGAQAAGAGKVAIVSPHGRVFDAGSPQLMSWSLADARRAADVLVIGCGLGTDARARRLLNDVLDLERALVIDADALNLLALEPRRVAGRGHASERPARGTADVLERRIRQRAGKNCPTVLTPHPLEAARLLRCDTTTVQSNRIGAALALARRFDATVVLKGAGSIVASADGRWGIVRAGGPALSTGGTGDVLAGALAACLHVQADPFAAAGIAAWIHADAGDRWSLRHPRHAGLSSAELPHWLTESLNAI